MGGEVIYPKEIKSDGLINNEKPEEEGYSVSKKKLSKLEQNLGKKGKCRSQNDLDENSNDNNYKRKNEKYVIIAKNKKPNKKHGSNEEKKVLELIHNNNPNKEDYDLIYEAIDKHFFMQTLNQQARNEIITTMSLCKVKSGQTLFKQGAPGNYWYIVHSGELSCLINGNKVKTFQAGDSFGEFALMNDAPRSATIIAETEVEVWVLKRQVFRKILDYLFQLNYEENLKFLESIHLPFESTIISIMANHLIQEIYKEDEYICHDGDLGSCMYIIKEGEVNCIKEDRIIRTLKAGDIFGQKAILEGDKRTLDVKAKIQCKLYSLSTEFFKIQFGSDFKIKLYYMFLSYAFLKSKNYNINKKIISKSFGLFKFKSFQNNEIIYEKGTDLKNILCVVLEGNIVDKAINRVEAKRYEILFEKKLYEGKLEKARNNLVADPDCLLAEVDYFEFMKSIGGDISAARKKSFQITSLDNIRLFKTLSDDKKEFLIENLQIENFANGKKIITQGEVGDKLYIIKQGRVDFFVNLKYIRSFREGEDFGFKSLILNSDKRTATAIANGSVTCFTLTSKVFKSILEPNLMEYFQNKVYLEDNTIELRDLENIKELGSGSFGFVNLVKNKKNHQLYAIKALKLKQIKEESLEECVELERDVLLKIDHPFIMKMVKYLKNENYIFFVNEYIKGKELWDVIRDIGLLDKEQTQFYGGSILLAIHYLHENKVIYRDIKPENVMVTVKGFLKIIDFGTVKEIKDRTSTIIGTSSYMAPEVIKGEGYSFEVDIWSIAVCMYEFFCGRLPFGEDYEDSMDIYKAVCNDPLEFPKFVHDEDFKKLMIKMLVKNPTNRLWQFDQIKEDPYFIGFDWNKLISLSYQPPHKVIIKESKDKNNSSIPYLSYLNAKSKENLAKRKMSVGFEKWLKNF